MPTATRFAIVRARGARGDISARVSAPIGIPVLPFMALMGPMVVSPIGRPIRLQGGIRADRVVRPGCLPERCRQKRNRAIGSLKVLIVDQGAPLVTACRRLGGGPWVVGDGAISDGHQSGTARIRPGTQHRSWTVKNFRIADAGAAYGREHDGALHCQRRAPAEMLKTAHIN
jgi:hypothetical protein